MAGPRKGFRLFHLWGFVMREKIGLFLKSSRKAIVSGICAIVVPFAIKYGVDADAVAVVVSGVVSAVLVWFVPNQKDDV